MASPHGVTTVRHAVFGPTDDVSIARLAHPRRPRRTAADRGDGVRPTGTSKGVRISGDATWPQRGRSPDQAATAFSRPLSPIAETMRASELESTLARIGLAKRPQRRPKAWLARRPRPDRDRNRFTVDA